MGGAVFYSPRAAKAAKNYRRRKLIAPDAAAHDHDEKYDYMSALRDDHKAFLVPALEQAPCLLYACEEYGPNDVALYCPTTGANFRLPFPGPPHDKRGFSFSCPGGWVFTTDEVGDPYLLNSLTGVQANLPPVKTIYRNDTWYDGDGRNVAYVDPEESGGLPIICWARHTEYLKVAMSAAVEVTECTVLIVHMPEHRISFARPGDTRWTLLSEDISYVGDILYNDTDGLFYILKFGGSISTVDLSGPSPKFTEILRRPLKLSTGNLNMYLAHGPSGELLQVWRNWEHVNNPPKYCYTYQDIVKEFYKECVDLVGEDDCGGTLSVAEMNDEEDGLYEADAGNKEIDASQLLREGIDLPHRLVDEVTTTMLLVFKVDIERQKLVELRDIGDHTLFLGRNSTACLPTKDFPAFEPNCAYLTDDCFDYSPMLRRDLGIWNIKKRSMQKLGDTWADMLPWLHLPAPIWIMPRF